MNKTNGTPDLEQELKGLKSILSVAQVVVSSLDLDEVLQNILYSAMAVMDMPAGSIALYVEGENQLELHAHAGLSERFTSRKRWSVSPGGLTSRILTEGEIFLIEDAADAPFFRNRPARAEGIRALVAIPLKIQNKIVGILYLDDFAPRAIPAHQIETLKVLASFASMSIDNARLHAYTRQLACTDGLTGLYNYRHFKQVFREELTRTRRYGKPMALIMFDIDNFKAFNDTHGHPKGDQALLEVTRIIRDSLREVDTLFRYGGEEFVAILPETDIPEALIAAERARELVQLQTVRKMGEISCPGLTVSVGVAAYPRDGADLETLLEAVDNLMYQAKRCGKNKVYHLQKAS